MSKTPSKKTPPVPTPPPEATKTEGDGFWDINPLDCLNDLVSGRVFEAPKAIAKEVTENADTATDETAEPASAHPQAPIINVNLGGLFKRSKPKPAVKPDGAPPAEEAGEAAGK